MHKRDLLSRRSMLTGIAAAIPAAAVAAPVAAMKAENPDLLELGRKLDHLRSAVPAANKAKRAALARFNEICPPVPDELVITRSDQVHLGVWGHKECDIEGAVIFQPGGVPRWIMRSDDLRGVIEEHGPRTKARKAVRRKLDVAEAYEAAVADAYNASGLADAVRTRDAVIYEVETVAAEIRKAHAETLAGAAIKARAILICGMVGNGSGALWAIRNGDDLAAAILDVAGVTL